MHTRPYFHPAPPPCKSAMPTYVIEYDVPDIEFDPNNKHVGQVEVFRARATAYEFTVTRDAVEEIIYVYFARASHGCVYNGTEAALGKEVDTAIAAFLRHAVHGGTGLVRARQACAPIRYAYLVNVRCSPLQC